MDRPKTQTVWLAVGIGLCGTLCLLSILWQGIKKRLLRRGKAPSHFAARIRLAIALKLREIAERSDNQLRRSS
jgi:hypothetical protein